MKTVALDAADESIRQSIALFIWNETNALTPGNIPFREDGYHGRRRTKRSTAISQDAGRSVTVLLRDYILRLPGRRPLDSWPHRSCTKTREGDAASR